MKLEYKGKHFGYPTFEGKKKIAGNMLLVRIELDENYRRENPPFHITVYYEVKEYGLDATVYGFEHALEKAKSMVKKETNEEILLNGDKIQEKFPKFTKK